MKIYKLNDTSTIFRTTDPVSSLQQVVHQTTDYSYSVPYERNDEYLKLVNQMDPRNPETKYEPEQGYYLYADFDFEYNYYAPEWQKLGAFVHQEASAAGTGEPYAMYLQSLNLFLLSGSGLVSNATLSYEDIFNTQFGVYESASVLQGDVDPIRFRDERILSKEYFEKSYDSIRTLISFFDSEPGSQHGVIWSGKKSPLYQISVPGAIHPEFINLDVARLYADNQNKREMFPYFSEFKLTGVQKNSFCTLLEQYDLVEDFINFLIMHRNPQSLTQDVEYIPMDLNTTSLSPPSIIKTDVYCYSMNEFLYHVKNHGNQSHISGFSGNQTTCEYFESFINQIIFDSVLEGWLNGAPKNQAMQIAFRLEKYSNPSPGSSAGGHISTHYFFNYDELLEFHYFDTQISYRNQFTYVVKAINAVVQDPPVITSSGVKDYRMFFFEEPYYSESIYVLDSPPVPPDVQLLTYRGVSDKLLILFNQQIDKEAAVPILINESDWGDGFERQYSAQNIPERDSNGNLNPIIFESDDPTDFELFKMTEHPVEYKDFANLNYRKISSNGGTSIGYHDTIIPNQYYYYTFRSQDMNGFVSNPTPVYEFVLIKEGETMYPRIRIVDFKRPDPPVQKSKTFKKYLKIGFSPRQYTIGDAVTGSIDDSIVGKDIQIGIARDDTADNNIIGSNRQFKFRIKSKNTGKLIDFNVTFKKNQVNKA